MVPEKVRIAIFAIFGYLGCLLFIAIGIMSSPPNQPGHAVAVFLLSFEVGPSLYLMVISPIFIGLGWSGIFVFAYFRKRFAVFATTSIFAIYAYFETTKELERTISFSALQQGVDVYLDLKSSGFAVHTIPFIIYFSVLLALTFRKKPK